MRADSSTKRFLDTKLTARKARGRRLIRLTPRRIGLRPEDLPYAPSRAHFWRQDMKSKSLAFSMLMSGIALAAGLAAPAAYAQEKEQFFPILPYRTGAYAPNGSIG